ncbi:flavin reductase family protein [Rubrivivax sp. JA1026]|uniref:flavin reductase family protein n=1 Tax=Rubrivivax sp. JA1026 TaxID=2710888 RepID=UPI0013E99141|nr:flavin reductase family protein [Rubrivivax sp. JA1026]
MHRLDPSDPKQLRRALGHFATGVTLVTCADADGQRVGLTVSSFQAVSLDPPLVLWSLREASPSLPAFRQASHFAVNVLSEAQLGLSRRFASPVPDKFGEGDWHAGEGGAPVLAGCAAVFECETVSAQAAGDHVLFIGRVCRLADAPMAPLLYQGGHYRRLGDSL